MPSCALQTKQLQCESLAMSMLLVLSILIGDSELMLGGPGLVLLRFLSQGARCCLQTCLMGPTMRAILHERLLSELHASTADAGWAA